MCDRVLASQWRSETAGLYAVCGIGQNLRALKGLLFGEKPPFLGRPFQVTNPGIDLEAHRRPVKIAGAAGLTGANFLESTESEVPPWLLLDFDDYNFYRLGKPPQAPAAPANSFLTDCQNRGTGTSEWERYLVLKANIDFNRLFSRLRDIKIDVNGTSKQQAPRLPQTYLFHDVVDDARREGLVLVGDE